MGVVLINLEESPPYQEPPHDPTSKCIVGKNEWYILAIEAPSFGRIVIQKHLLVNDMIIGFGQRRGREVRKPRQQSRLNGKSWLNHSIYVLSFKTSFAF